MDKNVNTRGNNIEQLITKGLNRHSAEDISIKISNGIEIQIDIKTKLSHLNSNPKAYNVDKVLKEMSKGNKIFAFLFIVIDVELELLNVNVVSILDSNFIDLTKVQFHWAGRNSRGVTQLIGNFEKFAADSYLEIIDKRKAFEFLKKLISLK